MVNQKLRIIDNSVVKQVKIIRIFKKGERGDFFIGSLQKKREGDKFKKGQLLYGMIAHTKRNEDRSRVKGTGIKQCFPRGSGGILINKDLKNPSPLSKRVYHPLPSVFRKKAFNKVLAISGEVLLVNKNTKNNNGKLETGFELDFSY